MKFWRTALCTSLFTIMGISANVQATDAKHSSHWTYTGPEGPAHWGDLSKDYHACKVGKSQSPVNISRKKASGSRPISISYESKAVSIVNNGHTIQINIADGSTITVDGKSYKLLQFHFHTPSEHTINGKPADMVAHLVHKAADGQLGVIGILMKKGNENAALAEFWAHMPEHAGTTANLAVNVNARNLLPSDLSYYSYSGSLTTPPCSEGVNWMLLKNPVDVSARQIAAFKSIIHQNIRPVQPLNGRKVISY